MFQEDQIYAEADNDREAPTLWKCSKKWLSLDRLLRITIRVMQDVEKSVNLGFEKSTPSLLRMSRHSANERNERNVNGKEQDERPLPAEPETISLEQDLRKLDKCSLYVQDDLMKPTANMLDMVCFPIPPSTPSVSISFVPHPLPYHSNKY